jgi:hypothetical protein
MLFPVQPAHAGGRPASQREPSRCVDSGTTAWRHRGDWCPLRRERAGRARHAPRTAATVTTPAANDVAATAAAADDDGAGGFGALKRPRLVGQDRDGVDLFDAVRLVDCLHSGRS